MHPRISVHEVSFPGTMDVDAILSWAASHGIAAVGLFSLRRRGGWDEAIARVKSYPISIAHLCHASMFILDDPSSWDASTQSLLATIDAAVAMSTSIVYATTGPAGRLDFEGAAEALSKAVIPARDYAASQGVKLLTETSNPLFGFTHFLHTLDDTIQVATDAGLGLCLDLHPTWHERAIRAKIVSAIDQIHLVQVSDYIPRNMTVTRDVVGAGIIPLEALLGTVFDAGYDGLVDLELFGRPQETALADIEKSVENLSEILVRLGA
jgi:sugar phosphate isomerase/epimerase